VYVSRFEPETRRTRISGNIYLLISLVDYISVAIKKTNLAILRRLLKSVKKVLVFYRCFEDKK